ncbi:3-methyladenine DNA glycosylase [Geodermatophilus aquaeductus]|uniref:DNA-3-methyladenine glycosylase II n=1 Tax=Geodermatophilus aquaeductus TaxID=1564161 RepID=A0A521EZS7_9ACTN|nr:DNA-3-methyladenine glycosylase 2 family protein [Geodermatophilus aquaeductus]SMO89306.1 3-methyladenine DNA glycosylase/8-oxoguanine DNA glycosylase [Geodermatophilus aquaeductus]
MPTGDVDVAATLGSLVWLPGDPTVRVEPGRFTRATWTPEGSGTVVVTWAPGDGTARVEASGDGAGWLLERAPRLLGCEDDVTGFDPAAAPLRDLWRRHRRRRIARTGTLWHDLACLVVQQRVSRVDAAEQWRRLVTTYGSPVPGAPGLWTPPSPGVLGRLSSPALHRLGLERRRAQTLVGAAVALARHQDLADADVAAGTATLRAVPGIGPWTTGCLAALTWGDRDAVITGDSGIPSLVAWVLAGQRRADDAAMLDLLAPHRPHRYRVLGLVMASGRRPPRHAPRSRREDITRR